VDVRLSRPRSARPSEVGLAVLFATSGVLHLLTPRRFEQIVPRPLACKRAVVYLSGVAEMGCAAGLVAPATRRAAGLASAVLLVAVFPANVQMALDVFTRRGWLARLLAAARLPLQAPLVAIAWRAWRR
jgi:uncharacterized membrane protein